MVALLYSLMKNLHAKYFSPFSISHPISVLIKYKLTAVYFLVEHGQQHIVIRRKQLVDPGSLKQGAENLQQLVDKNHNKFFKILT